MTTDRLVIEAMARYLCRDYWQGDVARWDEFTGQAKDLLAIARAENPDIGEQHCDAARRTPRVFTADDPEPTGVAAVRDRMGFTWKLNEGGWKYTTGTTYSWYVVKRYAPLTEVPTAAPAARVWHAGDEEPTDVQVVRDKDGDRWDRDELGWRHKSGDPFDWGRITRNYGPVTEVFPSREDTQ